VDLICADAGANATCLVACNPDADDNGHSSCATAEQCALLSTSTAKPNLGVCSKNSGPLKQALPNPTDLTPPNFAAKTISLPGVKPWQPPAAPEKDDGPSVEEGGCNANQQGGGGSGPMALVAALCLLAAARRDQEIG